MRWGGGGDGGGGGGDGGGGAEGGGGGGGHSFLTEICSTLGCFRCPLGQTSAAPPTHTDPIWPLPLLGCLRSVQTLESEARDVDEFLQLVITSTCRPTLGSREFITNQPPHPISRSAHRHPPNPDQNPLVSNCLHPVIRQINGRA